MIENNEVTEAIIRVVEQGNGLTLSEVYERVYGMPPEISITRFGHKSPNVSAIRTLMCRYNKGKCRYARPGTFYKKYVAGKRHKRYFWEPASFWEPILSSEKVW